jgi:uncharacterized protein (TIGR04255 family)
MTFTHRLIFIDNEANKSYLSLKNGDLNMESSIDKAASQPSPPKRYYNFLDEVLFGVQFKEEVESKEELVNALHKRLKDIFPVKLLGMHNVLETNIISPERIEQKQRILVLPNFQDDGKTKQLFCPQPKVLTIRQLKYTSFDEFYKILKQTIDAFEQVYLNNTAVQQVSLQYINRIELSGYALDWKKLIKNELISLLNFPREKDEIARAMNLLELTREGYNVRFQSGIFNRDYPHPVVKREFILDYACYSTEECQIKQVLGLADKYHTEIKLIFNDSILKALKQRLGEV